MELIARPGVRRSKEQYLATLFVLQPVQQLWEHALSAGGLSSLQTRDGLAIASRAVACRRLFLHGPGGSGKTYCMTEVVVKVVRQFFGDRGVKAIAAANSAARLLRGKTMHAAGKMSRGQSLKAKHLRPNSKAKKALQAEWEYLVLLLGDELSVSAPPLLAGISRRASHGRRDLMDLDLKRALEEPFGNVLLQALMGDFMQLNPVKSHTLLEALARTARVPGVPRQTKDEDGDGYSIFRKVCENVVLFTGTHRFLDKDLPALLEIMRTPGGRPVPEALRRAVEARIVAGPEDPRLAPDFVHEGVPGFFALGAKAAIQWEQVARMQQLHVLVAAGSCPGPRARCNLSDGKPDLARHGFSAQPAGFQGQLVYYFQAVDRFTHRMPLRDAYIEALKFVSQSKSAGMQGMPGLYLGMRVRLTRKLLPPELVQEATGEVVGLALHLRERFGQPGAVANLRPPDDHACWTRAWVRCDHLPLYVEVRFDDCTEDYAGPGKPGVWHAEPTTDSWALPRDRCLTINHPNAARPKRVKVTGKKKQTTVEVRRTGLPLGPELVVTYQNVQGQTIRGPEGQPKGFVLDMYRPSTMRGEGREPEYFQHIYMGLGRARRLEWVLLRNFPRTAGGELDWGIFENGPPDYLVEFLQVLDKLAARTLPRLLRAQEELGMPAFEDVPGCEEDLDDPDRFLYDPEAWNKAVQRSATRRAAKRRAGTDAGRDVPEFRKRQRVAAADVPASDALKGPPPGGPSAGSSGDAEAGASSGDAPRVQSTLRPPERSAVCRGRMCDLLGRRVGTMVLEAPQWCPCGRIESARWSYDRPWRPRALSFLDADAFVTRFPFHPQTISHETSEKHRVTRFGFVLARRRRLLDFEENRSEFIESARGRTGRGHRIDSTGYNDRRCGAVDPAAGTQVGLTCGLFAVNHCLGRAGMRTLAVADFRHFAGDGLYPEGDFDDSGLRRNLARLGCSFDMVSGAEHQELVRYVDGAGTLSMFFGDHALGCVIHTPRPRHWVALVPAVRGAGVTEVAWLCDSLFARPFALSTSDVQSMFELMAVSHLAAGDAGASQLQREQHAAGWSACPILPAPYA